jgi:hypothetical protein
MKYQGIDVSKKSSTDAAMLIFKYLCFEFCKNTKELDVVINRIMDVFVKKNIPSEYKDILYEAISFNLLKDNKPLFEKIKELALKHCSSMIEFHSKKDEKKHFLWKNKSSWIKIKKEVENINPNIIL